MLTALQRIGMAPFWRSRQAHAPTLHEAETIAVARFERLLAAKLSRVSVELLGAPGGYLAPRASGASVGAGECARASWIEVDFE